MKRLLLLIVLVVAVLVSLSAQSVAPATSAAVPADKSRTLPLFCYRVSLTDKGVATSPYSVEHPEAFLSERAIAKRQRFGIAITEDDLPLNPAYVDAIRTAANPRYLWSPSKWNNSLVVILEDTTTLPALRALACVREVLPVGTYGAESSKRAASALRDTIADIDTSYYGVAYRQIAALNGHRLHQEGYRGEGMLVAMLDGGWSGFNEMGSMAHLYQQGRIVGTYNVLPHGGPNGYSPADVYFGTEHGTHCTTLIAADNDYEMVGAAPDADFVLVVTEDVEVELLVEEDYWARGAEIADSLGADVISSSLGYTKFDDDSIRPVTYAACDGVWSVASRAATMAAHRGIVVCIAAGNDGANEWHKLSRPSDAADVLCVGAISVDSLYAPFSSCGPSFDGRVKPDVVSPGWDVYVINTDDTARTGSGTSYATPILAGLATCLWQSLPQLTSLELMQVVRESATQHANPDTLLGYGIPDIYQAWLDHKGTSVAEQNAAARFSLYPNPCADRVSLLNESGQPFRYELYDLSGRRVLRVAGSSADSAVELDLSECRSGIYFVRVVTADGAEEVLRMVKSR